MVALVPAAIPSETYYESRSIDLTTDGLETMIRLGWKDGKGIIEIWQDEGVETLERACSPPESRAFLITVVVLLIRWSGGVTMNL